MTRVLQVMTVMPDWVGISVVITAVGAFIVTVGRFVVVSINEVRGRIDVLDVKLEATHALVNGLSERKDVAIGAAAKLEGKAEGVAAERANPQVSAKELGR